MEGNGLFAGEGTGFFDLEGEEDAWEGTGWGGGRADAGGEGWRLERGDGMEATEGGGEGVHLLRSFLFPGMLYAGKSGKGRERKGRQSKIGGLEEK